MNVKISAVIIGSIDIDVDALKIDGVNIFKVTDRKSCEEIINKISSDDLVFIISDGREVYYAEKFFSRIMTLKIFLVTEAHAADNKNLRDAIIQLPAQDFIKDVCEIINAMKNLSEKNFEEVKAALKNSGKATAYIGSDFSDFDVKPARTILLDATATDEDLKNISEKIKSAVSEDAKIIYNGTIGDTVKIILIVAKFI